MEARLDWRPTFPGRLLPSIFTGPAARDAQARAKCLAVVSMPRCYTCVVTSLDATPGEATVESARPSAILRSSIPLSSAPRSSSKRGFESNTRHQSSFRKFCEDTCVHPKLTIAARVQEQGAGGVSARNPPFILHRRGIGSRRDRDRW